VRKYASVSPMFWVRGSGKRLRGNKDAQILALYLMSCPAATMAGIFPMSLPTMCHETGLDEKGAREALECLSQEAFAYWDEAEELAWVPALPLHQVGERISVNSRGKKDHRHSALVKALEPFKGHRFYAQFIDRYGDAYLLTEPKEEGASKGHSSPICPVPVSSSDQDQPIRSGSEGSGGSRPDRFGESLRGSLPHQREDVGRVFEKFKQVFGLPSAKLSVSDVRATYIAEAIRDYGEAACMLVLKYASQDGMVSGKADDRGQPHKTIKYILGNREAFERIHAEAQKREGIIGNKRPANEIVAAARRL
jgi:hypothetical protein